MRNKKLKKGFISVVSACLVFSSSFNAYALKPLEWKKSIKILNYFGEELSTGANIERGTTLYADLYFSVDPQNYEVQWYVDNELTGTGEEFTVPEGAGFGTLYAHVEGQGPAELTSTNKYFSFGTGQFYIEPGTDGDNESMGEGEKEEVTYSLELTGTPSAGETLTSFFSPIEKVGGMGDISYIWFINGNATTSESGYKKESTTYTVNKWNTGEVYVEAYFEDINSESQQIQSNILTIQEVDYSLEIAGTPEVGETIEAIINPELDAWVNWYVNGEYTDTNALNNEQSRFYTIKDGDEEIYAMIYTTKYVISNTLTVEKTEAGEGGRPGEGNTGTGGTEEGGNTGTGGNTEEGGDSGNTETGGAGDTGNGEGNTENGENAGNESTDNKNEAGDTDNKGDNTDDKGNTDNGTDEDGSLDDDINISTPSDAEKEENTGNNNSNSHSSSSHSSSNSTNSEPSEVYKWEFVNYKNQNYKWFWKSNKSNIHKGWLLCPLDGYWYYFDLEEGYMLEGLQVIDGKTYYFQKQEETPSQTYYLEGGEWVYKAPSTDTRPWGSMQ